MNIKNKLSSLMYAPLALALLAACSSDDVVENNQPTTQGQTLTINATTGGEDGTRVDFGNDGNGKYATSWEATDKVNIYAGNINNVGTFTVDGAFTNHNAKLTGKLSTKLTEKTTITGYIVNGKVKTSNNGVIVENGFGKQIEMDYSVQDGTWEDAVSRCVLFGKGTYDPANASQPVDMMFEYKTTFLKLILNFGDESINTTASMCLTGDNMVSNSRIHATGATAGQTNYAKDLFINIKDVNITNGTATVYVAMYPRDLNNVYLQAVLKNGVDGADGDVYDFNISKNSTTATKLNPGIVYTIERTGIKEGTSSTWEGEGSETNPYLIKSVADLKLLANKLKEYTGDAKYGYNNKYFELTSDLIINGEWEPIGNSRVEIVSSKETTISHPFRGTFNGAGHTISGNITINNLEKNNCAGLFGVIGNGAVIKNVTSKINIDAHSKGDNTITTFTGAIIGRAFTNCTIENCVNKGSVVSTTQFVGGMIGSIQLDGKTDGQKVVVEACTNEGDVINNINSTNGTLSSGGLIGNVNGSKDAAVKSTLEVKGCSVIGSSIKLTKNKNKGGIIGNIQNTGSAEQTIVTACLVNNLNIEKDGNIASIVSSPTGNDKNKLLFTLNHCWADVKYGAGFYKSTNATANECKIALDVALDQFYTDMNTAWNSATYKFNSKGEIVKKTK